MSVYPIANQVLKNPLSIIKTDVYVNTPVNTNLEKNININISTETSVKLESEE